MAAQKLLLTEFVKVSLLEEVVLEGFDDYLGTANDIKANAREEDMAKKQQANAQAIAAEPLKKQLVNYIVNEMPRLQSAPGRLSLADVVLRQGGNINTTLADPAMRPVFYKLFTGIKNLVQGEASRNAESVKALVAQTQSQKVEDWVRSLAPRVEQELKKKAQ